MNLSILSFIGVRGRAVFRGVAAFLTIGLSSSYGFNWVDYLPLVSFNQWVMTSESTEPLRVESIGGPFFRTSFKDIDRDYRDQFQLTPDGLHWVNAYWLDGGGQSLFVDFGLPGVPLCPLGLTEGVVVPFSGSASGTVNPGSIPVTCTFSGDVFFARFERRLVANTVIPVAIVKIDVQMTVDDGTSTIFTREISTTYAILYGYGPVGVENSSSDPVWSYVWELGDFGGALPTYGSGYWSTVPPDPRTGRKLTGIGVIDDQNFPWIYHYGEGGWLWVSTSASTGPFNLWLWSATDENWIWASDLWGGWHYRFLSGWTEWP
ncbi:hypothetical protein G0Q06_12510 [Puniceicoccales bacterium CK1056]|uniref:Uncharacterized protein n=1 Tax=Oceanipulchritudo coccoides TaxID=2706888 RepID=A0A6B2M4X4_9BACT|nr:hypothetical protein [Oceanipulchritudo coccoides]NDV63279.1 hypothetical protein [Oceanipulchritudo coccoides]